MESTPKEQVHKDDVDCDEDSQVNADCLRMPLVLRNILKHFSNAELLTLSLVNKFWNYEARSMMKKRDSLTASLKLHSCQSHITFASCLHQMNIVPFSGITIMLTSEKDHECEPPSNEEPLDSSHRIILDRLQWKHLSVTLSGFCTKCKQLPAFLLLRTILKDKCGALEELSLSIHFKLRTTFIHEFLQHCSFPRLRVLTFGQLQKYDPLRKDAKSIKALVSLSPNLQELRVPDWCDRFRGNVLKRSSAVLLTNCSLNYYGDWYYSRRITDEVRFERVRLGVLGYFNVGEFNSMIPDMLQRSRTTLTSLYIQSALAVPLMFYGICFDNVRKFAISQHDDHLDPAIMSLLKTFDFTRIFPNLDRVITGDFYCGRPSEEGIKGIVDHGKGLWKEPLPDRAVKIKHLSLSDTFNESTAPFFAQMLPNIEALSVDPRDLESIPFGLIWEHWADLKELHVRSHLREHERSHFLLRIQLWCEMRVMPNLDSEFCGIFPQEVAVLREEDDEYLRKVNIVPVKPSISCLKDLRTFKFYCQPHSLQCYEFFDSRPTLSITKVSGLIAFARCPRLSVTLQTVTIGDAEALRHMKPYATIMHVGRNIWPWNDMEIHMK